MHTGAALKKTPQPKSHWRPRLEYCNSIEVWGFSLLQVLLYATALSKAIEEQGLEAKSNGSLIVEKIWSSTIQGKSLLSKNRFHFSYCKIFLLLIYGFLSHIHVCNYYRDGFELGIFRPKHWDPFQKFECWILNLT